jgi:hypothetical protein
VELIRHHPFGFQLVQQYAMDKFQDPNFAEDPYA